MASTGLITAEQLQTVVQAIMSKVLKVNLEGAPTVVSTSLGNLNIVYNQESQSLTFTDTESYQSVVLDLPNGSEYAATIPTIIDGIINLNHINVDSLSGPYTYGSTNLRYCLPDAVGTGRDSAMHPQTGGGALLSTRYRAYEPVVFTPDSGSSPSVSRVLDIQVRPYVYNAVYNASVINVAFNETTNSVNEYWIDIEFPSDSTPTVTFADFANDNKVLWTGEGEPDWSTLGGRRIQIHILAGMASYVISAEEGVSEEQ